MFLLLLNQAVASEPGEGTWRLRYMDALTGLELEPERVTGTPGIETRAIPAGVHAVEVEVRGYSPVQSTLMVPDDGSAGELRLWLDPTDPPRNLTRASIQGRAGTERMLFHGYVVDDRTGRPMVGAHVTILGADRTAVVDADGYFEFLIPVAAKAGDAERHTLLVDAPGHVQRRIDGIEAWRGGDWLLRFRLHPGEGVEATQEPNRRQGLEATPVAGDPGFRMRVPEPEARHALPSADPTVAVRVPRMIRVQTSTGIDYVSLETYVKRVLPSEWIASWGTLNQNRGMNCLRAGAVAIRTYGVGFVHQPAHGTYDICSTASCQVYRSSVQSLLTDVATDDTAGNVLVDGTGWVGFKLTEYSAENNGLGAECGDGYMGNAGTCREDKVCGGLQLKRNGHGRGMCQNGSARWATGWYRVNENVGGNHNLGIKNWQAILQHYYPNLTLKAGSPLAVGDGVEIWDPLNERIATRACAGGTITQGTGCTLLTRYPNGTRGHIIDGPRQVTADGNGYTWWKIRWTSSGVEGWTAENYLQRATAPAPIPCTYTRVGSGTVQLEPDGGTGSLQINTSRTDCQWTATTDASWLTVTTASGSGSGTIQYSASRNTQGSERSAEVRVGDLRIQFRQGASCIYSLSGTRANIPATGDQIDLGITAGNGCGWTASATEGWLSITPGSGSSSGVIEITVQPNTAGTPREAQVTVAGANGWQATYRVVQAASAVVTEPSIVRMSPVTASAGGTIQVPVQLGSRGTENSMGFSVSFDASALTFRGVVRGPGAPAGMDIQTNLPAGGGGLGVILALPPGQVFAMGDQSILLLELTVQPGISGESTRLEFTDQPIAREVVSVTASELPFLFTGTTVSIARGIEGDVAPRPNGNGLVGVADWVQVGRFVALLDAPESGSERQRADCAPRDTGGNGSLTLADWVQAGRYAAMLDLPKPAAGPARLVETSSSLRSAGTLAEPGGRKLFVRNALGATGDYVVLEVELDAEGNENAVGFSLGWDPAVLEFSEYGSIPPGLTPVVNLSQVASGRIGFLLALPAGQQFQRGTNDLVEIRCKVRDSASAGVTSVRWMDQPIQRELIDVGVGILSANYVDGQIRIESASSSRHTLSVSTANGSVVRDPDLASYVPGTHVLLTARPDAGYRFVRWTGDITSSSSVYSIQVDRDLRVTAVFEPIESPGASIVLGVPERHPEGGWNIRISGPPGSLYQLEESEDLLRWQPVSAGELPSLGSHTNRVQRRSAEEPIYFRTRTVQGSALTFRPGPRNSKDIWTTSVYSYAPDRQFPGGGLDNDQLRVGGWGDDYWGLMEFDLRTLPMRAAQVRLELYCHAIGNGGGTPMQVHRITEPWSWKDRLWWADRPDMVLSSETIHPPATADSWYSMDITALYNGWQSGQFPNHGLALVPMETWNNFNHFVSGDTTNVALRPRLVVTRLDSDPGPQLLVDNLQFPLDPVVSADHVYFTDNLPTRGVIRRIPKAGGPAVEFAGNIQTVDSGTVRGPSGLIVAGDHLYGHHGGYESLTVFRIRLSGGAPEALASISGGILLAADASHVWYSSGFNDVVRMELANGTREVQARGVWPRGYASDAEAVFYVDYNTKHLWRLDKQSGETHILRNGTGAEGHLAAGGGFLFLNLNGSIHRVPKAGGPDAILVTGAFGGGQASDGQRLYYLKGARIRSIPVGGGPESDLAPGPDGETEIVVDGTHVYWTDWSRGPGRGQVWRIAKP